MSLPVEFHPAAAEEVRAAENRYWVQCVETAVRFGDELDRSIALIGEFPEMFAPHVHNTRFYRLKHFPFLVVYRIHTALIQVVAVAHERRRPGYWQSRISSPDGDHQ